MDLKALVALTKPRILVTAVGAVAVGAYIAPQAPGPGVLFGCLLGMGLVVGGANALNMYLERDIDARMERTRGRPLPARLLPPRTALWFGMALAAAGIPVVTFGANALSGLLAALSLISYVLVYTPLKQKTSFALLVGSIPGAMPPLIGWTAATGRLELPGIVLFSIMFVWQVPHFLAISLFRSDEYARAGLVLMPHETGERKTRLQIVLWSAVLVPVSLLPFMLGVAGALYLLTAVGLGTAFFVWGLKGLKETQPPAWPRQLFALSLVYLVGIFAALVADSGGRL